ncbi:hypothetical protein LMJ53_15465 [Rheinheimera sp. UJ51]|uniref:hypothetical protein n=1 Tax=Rheinheimera sp. UJ51 TaxID=2892446 RepID=UPI001E605CE9|nr:hypothetical protein [Rheinheimera sp. UJ51]MCC5453121.1 hypothetical protein [Rheinheimera sp. UJ51]
MNKTLLSLLLCLTFGVTAGPAYDLFGDGVFSLKWGAQPESVMATYPSGKKTKNFGITLIEIKDDRAVFGLNRSKNDTIRFAFDSENRLSGVSIDFSPNDFPMLHQKLITQFGQPQSPPSVMSGTVILVWENDNGVILSLNRQARVTSLSIGFDALQKPKNTKEDLGF